MTSISTSSPLAQVSPTPPSDSLDLAPLYEALDTNLERYLHLLAEYTSLRETLHSQLASGFLSLAQANFAAPSHVRRYGSDYYDERMKAQRRVTIDEPDGSPTGTATPRVSVTKTQPPRQNVEPATTPANGTDGDVAADGNGMDGGAGGDHNLSDDSTPEDAPLSTEKPRPDATAENERKGGDKQEERKKRTTPVDPLHWFGVLVPPALRAAQAHFVTAVEGPVPRLCALRAEMREVEAAVGRARKAIRKAGGTPAGAPPDGGRNGGE